MNTNSHHKQPPAQSHPENTPEQALTLAQDNWASNNPLWHRVSMNYAWIDLVFHLVWVVIVAAASIIMYSVPSWQIPLFVTTLVATLALLLLVNALFAFRRVKSIGYILRKDDMLFRRGIMFERVIAVPYGRLQLVDITRGPMLRAFGLATLKFVTASAATGVNLPGLRDEDAQVLRDRLVELAETRRSGL